MINSGRPPRPSEDLGGFSEDLPGTVSLSDLLAMVRRNLVLLAGLPLLGAFALTYHAISQPKLYQASALLQLDPRPAKVLARDDELYDPGYESISYYGTQRRILESRKLASQLAKRLDLAELEEFGGPKLQEPPKWSTWLSALPGLPDPPEPEPVSEDKRWERTVARVQNAISARLAPTTTLFEVNFSSRSPELAAQAANALCDLYVEELLQARLDIYAKANSWLNSKLNTVQGDLSEAEQALQSFRDARDIVNVGGNRGLMESEVTDATRRLREAERERQRLENLYREIQRLTQEGADLGGAEPLLADPALRQAGRAYLTARAQLDELESRYGKRHPQYLAAETRYESLETTYKEQLASNARGVLAELESARNTEAQLRRQKREVEQKLRSLDRSEFELNMLEREVRSNRQLYDAFLTRFQETESNSSFSEANARIADPAVPPRGAYEPNVRKQALTGFAIGAAIALLLTLFRETLRFKIESPDELEQLSTAPLLGVVPHSRARHLDKHLVQHMHDDARSPFADAVRSLKTAILMNREAGDKCLCLAITSTEPAEGKSTITTAMGCVFAANARVLLIDTDLRRPRLARIFGTSSSKNPGLADILQGKSSFESAVQTDELSGLSFLPAGQPPPNPALLLESTAFKSLVQYVRERYDFVFFDTPPVLATSDALHLADSVDGYVVVARAERTHRKAFAGALKRLDGSAALVRGTILNDASTKRSAYGQGYYYYGSSYRY
nr:polysaccharide biosynthesis tyrosine autokinase [Oceanococcus sp. HetDA_MAG_MS8]